MAEEPKDGAQGDGIGYANFVCHKCKREWFLCFPMPLRSEAFTSLLRGVRCPDCAATGRHIGMSEAKELPQPSAKEGKLTLHLESLHCIHCGATFTDVPGSEEPLEWFEKHDSECQKHPLWSKAAAYDRLMAAFAPIAGYLKMCDGERSPVDLIESICTGRESAELRLSTLREVRAILEGRDA